MGAHADPQRPSSLLFSSSSLALICAHTHTRTHTHTHTIRFSRPPPVHTHSLFLARHISFLALIDALSPSPSLSHPFPPTNATSPSLSFLIPQFSAFPNRHRLPPSWPAAPLIPDCKSAPWPPATTLALLCTRAAASSSPTAPRTTLCRTTSRYTRGRTRKRKRKREREGERHTHTHTHTHTHAHTQIHPLFPPCPPPSSSFNLRSH